MAEGGEEIKLDVFEGNRNDDDVDDDETTSFITPPIDDDRIINFQKWKDKMRLTKQTPAHIDAPQSHDNPSYVDGGVVSTSTHINTPQSHDNPPDIRDGIPKIGEETRTVKEREESRDEAWGEINAKYPELNKKKVMFRAWMGEHSIVKVELRKKGSKVYDFFGADGEINSDLPKTYKENLGLPVETVIEKLVKNIQRRKSKNKEDRAQLDRVDISEEETKEISERLETRVEAVAEGEQKIAILENRMKLKDRIKSIFKRHGFTVVSIVTAVAAIIGVIISNLKTGLAKMAKGVGNGLKEIGKKLGAILPGMIGAIASFIFKTAGEVVGFLTKNAWLLIIAVVIFVIDQFKNRASIKSFKKKR